VATDRPKASYLDWFKELIANYKLLAMLIVAMGGYSGLNLWKDVESYRANQSVTASHIEIPTPPNALPNALDLSSKYSTLGHAHKQQAFRQALNAHIERDHIKDHKELHQ